MTDTELLMPPEAYLGYYMKPGDCEKVYNWLENQRADGYVLSLDMLAFGGLVASRSGDTEPERFLERIRRLKRIRSLNPEKPIYAFNVIRRASSTVNSVGSRELWERLNAYFRAIGAGLLHEARIIETGIPDGYLREYKALRLRNHTINQYAISLTSEKVFDLLSLTMEDTFDNGPQKEELKALNRRVESLSLEERVFIHNGADEAGQEMLSRMIYPEFSTINVHYDNDSTAGRIHDFEDRIFKENVDSHLKVCGFSENAQSICHLVISGTDVEETVRKCSNIGNNICLLDVYWPNGGNPELIDRILESGNFPKLIGYSAWNTASNSLGTALSILKIATSGKADKNGLKSFLLERIADDMIYQRICRPVLELKLENVHGDIFHVSDNEDLFKKFINEMYTPIVNRYFSKIKSGDQTILTDHLSLSLPWDRTFECLIETYS
jgi:hypothetical protein